MKLQTRDNVFNKQQPFSVRRSGFDISHKNITALDMGIIYPVSCFHVVPNDNIKIRAQYNFIMEALKKAPFTNIKVKFRSYYVAYRYLWKLWRNYYTRGRDGNYSTLEPKVLLRSVSNVKNSIYDYLGFPLNSQFEDTTSSVDPTKIDSYVLVSAFPFIAYDFIYYWNYINPHLQENIIYNIQDQIKTDNIDENDFITYLSDTFYVNIQGRPIYTRCIHPKSWIGSNGSPIFPNWDDSMMSNITPLDVASAANFGFLYRYNWEKDYFTSSYTQRQLGNPLSVPISTSFNDTNSANTPLGTLAFHSDPYTTGTQFDQIQYVNQGVGVGSPKSILLQFSNTGLVHQNPTDAYVYNSATGGPNYMREYLNRVSVISGSFNWNDVRLIAQTSIIQEGALLSPDSFEYGGYLKYFFGTKPHDDVLQKPEFIGGYNSPFFTSEIYQNAPGSDSVVGEYAGRGSTVDDGYIGDYHVKEFGLIMTICVITPSNVSQSSQGINKTWLYDDSFSYYNPAFAHLGLQGIEKGEVYATGNPSLDKSVFGFTGAFNELRYICDTVTSDMRDSMDFWHLARKYSSQPSLTSNFIKEDPQEFKRIYSVQREDTPNIYGIINMVVHAYRPLPELAVPELIDHRF